MATVLWLGLGNAIIWGPLVLHWRVTPAPVAEEVVQAHRQQPADAVLDAVAEMSMTTDHPLRGEAAVAVAQRLLLRGELALPHLPVIAIDPGFARRDLSQGVPVQHIFTSSLIVPDLLLRAHAHAPDPAYVAAAWRYARGFIEFEASVLLPRDYERNSHAVANRASVLARLWRRLRQAPGYDAETGRLIHLHAQRIGALLAKPSTFIASTNHGVMQNIGLLQLATAFPALPQAGEWRQLAQRRLALQLPGWIGPDGAVLEHSSGYHFHGVVLSGYVVKLFELLSGPVAPEWAAAHQRAREFMQLLQRPDRSLPPYGNTFRYAWRLPPVLGMDESVWERRLRERATIARLFPVSGHAVWWDSQSAAGVATHTHVPWGYFPGHGHRRAQELSLLVWAAGTDWSTNTGYWPSDDIDGIHLTDGWVGSNAPHVEGEATTAGRRSTLIVQAESPGLRFIDLERVVTNEGAGSLRVRRQILQWQGSTWIALDTYADSERRPLRVLWTVAPETTQQLLGERAFRFERADAAVSMTLGIEGSPDVLATAARGRREPFAGWVAFDRKAAAAPAVEAKLANPQGWMLATLRLHARDASRNDTSPAAQGPMPTVVRFSGPQQWTLRLDNGTGGAAAGGIEVTRRDDQLSIHRPADAAGAAPPERILKLEPAASTEAALAVIAQSRSALLVAYPRYRTNEWQRRRFASLLYVGWGVTAALLLLCACRQRAAGQRNDLQ